MCFISPFQFYDRGMFVSCRSYFYQMNVMHASVYKTCLCEVGFLTRGVRKRQPGARACMSGVRKQRTESDTLLPAYRILNYILCIKLTIKFGLKHHWRSHNSVTSCSPFMRQSIVHYFICY
jgi:hypothetical protein